MPGRGRRSVGWVASHAIVGFAGCATPSLAASRWYGTALHLAVSWLCPTGRSFELTTLRERSPAAGPDRRAGKFTGRPSPSIPARASCCIPAAANPLRANRKRENRKRENRKAVQGPPVRVMVLLRADSRGTPERERPVLLLFQRAREW